MLKKHFEWKYQNNVWIFGTRRSMVIIAFALNFELLGNMLKYSHYHTQQMEQKCEKPKNIVSSGWSWHHLQKNKFCMLFITKELFVLVKTFHTESCWSNWHNFIITGANSSVTSRWYTYRLVRFRIISNQDVKIIPKYLKMSRQTRDFVRIKLLFKVCFLWRSHVNHEQLDAEKKPPQM